MQLISTFKRWFSNDNSTQAYENFKQEVEQLSIEQARHLAERRLENDPDFEVVKNTTVDIPEELSVLMQNFFGDYYSVSWLQVSRVSLGDWKQVEGDLDLFSIGEDTELSLVVYTGDDAVHIFDGEHISSTYQSIYHWILMLREEYSVSLNM